MKKYFMFAAVVTAGMLASCSSESLTGSDPEIKTPAQEELVPIEIGVATIQSRAITRGTGTVGDIETGTNIWKGEKVNVLMYNLNTFTFATDGAATPKNLYDNTISLITPLASASTAKGLAREINEGSGDPYTAVNVGDASYKVKYYPATGRYDFWGYYLGGEGVSPSADGGSSAALVDVTATCDDNTTPTPAKAVAFTLDGARDLMVAKAATGAAETTSSSDIVGDVPFTANQTAAVTDGKIYASSYSAKSARGSLQPDLLFKHALTRLTFQVMAGNTGAVGVKVKAIKVYSKVNGQLVVAYDYTQGNISAANSIIWANTYNDAADFTTDSDGDGLKDYQDPDIYTALSLQERNAGAMQALTLTGYELTNAEIATPKAIGEALLVAPQKKYWLEVEYDASTVTAEDWIDNSEVTSSTGTYPPITADITRTTPTDVFEAGKSYNITITLYGPQRIEITTSLEPWTNVNEEISIVGE